MDDEREPMVTPADMKRLRDLWPPAIFNHMKWFQQNLDLMRKSAKREFSQERPMPCRFCRKVIRVNMYRHVARLHLDLVQLWRCPIAWFTSRLFGAFTEWPRCSVDIEDSEYREICPTMDCASGVVDRVAAGGAFRYFKRHTAVQ